MLFRSTENNIKNKFYTVLKKIATRAQLENPKKYTKSFIKCKRNLLQFVDIALSSGTLLSSKRGRKGKQERKLALQNAIIFPSLKKQDNSYKPSEDMYFDDSVLPSVQRPTYGVNFGLNPLLCMTYGYPVLPLITNCQIVWNTVSPLYKFNPESMNHGQNFPQNKEFINGCHTDTIKYN